MDDSQKLMKGGKRRQPIQKQCDADASEIKRLMPPVDNDDHAAKEKSQPTGTADCIAPLLDPVMVQRSTKGKQLPQVMSETSLLTCRNRCNKIEELFAETPVAS